VSDGAVPQSAFKAGHLTNGALGHDMRIIEATIFKGLRDFNAY
jgi:hypothetical protein